MKHKKCGGRMQRIQKTSFKNVYQCNRCGKILTVYHKRIKTATSGSLERSARHGR